MEIQRKPGLVAVTLLCGLGLLIVAPSRGDDSRSTSRAGIQMLTVRYDCGATPEEAWSGLGLDATGDIFREPILAYRVEATSGGPAEFCQAEAGQMLQLGEVMDCITSLPWAESSPGESRLSLQLICNGSRDSVVRRLGRILNHFYGVED
jgi:hypothetical protein